MILHVQTKYCLLQFRLWVVLWMLEFQNVYSFRSFQAQFIKSWNSTSVQSLGPIWKSQERVSHNLILQFSLTFYSNNYSHFHWFTMSIDVSITFEKEIKIDLVDYLNQQIGIRTCLNLLWASWRFLAHSNRGGLIYL